MFISLVDYQIQYSFFSDDENHSFLIGFDTFIKTFYFGSNAARN